MVFGSVTVLSDVSCMTNRLLMVVEDVDHMEEEIPEPVT